MEYLQYIENEVKNMGMEVVLNLIINGIPSILGKASGEAIPEGMKF